MKSLKFLALIILTIISSKYAMSQPHRDGGGATDGSITGLVVEAKQNLPLEYVSVVIYSQRDSSMVAGVVTDVEGNFSFNELGYGRYYMELKFLGFEKKTISGIKVNPKTKNVKIGTVTLNVAEQTVGDVVVEVDKLHLEYKIDKKVINVAQDLSSMGGTAVDVLENTPSVETDIDGNVSIRGSSNFTVLINGKPSVLDGSDALQQIPASTIDQIEIITNPSSKYDPDGVAGIINVITKQKKTNGFNGIFNVSANTNESYNADILLNYKLGKMNFFVSGNYKVRNSPGLGSQEQRTYFDSTTYFLFNDSHRNWHRNGYKGLVGFDYYINDNNTLTVSGDYGYRDFGLDQSTQNHEYILPGTFDEYFERSSLFNISGFYYTTNLNYEHKFDDKGHKISTVAYYSKWDAGEINSLIEDTTDNNWNKVGQNTYKQQSYETKDRTKYRLEISYELPIGENNKIEAGYTGRYDMVLSDYTFDIYDYSINDWQIDDNQTNDLFFTYNIQAGYGIFSGTYKTFGYQAGLRTEYTDRVIEQGENTFSLNRFDFFPSVHLSNKFKGNNQLQASYSRRISRPRGWFLNPFPFYIDRMNVRSGNPDLFPEYIDSYELNYMKRIKMSFISLEAYYRQTNNKIERVKYLTEDDIMLSTFDNLSKDYSIGMELMTNLMLAKWLIINVSGNVYQYNIDGEILDTEVDKSTFMWSGRSKITLKFKTQTRIQLSGFYRAPSITSQGTMGGFYMAGVAVKQDFFKKKLSLTINVRDVFNTMKHKFVSESANFYSYDKHSHYSSTLSLSLSYKINNYKKNNKRSGSNNVDFGGEGQY